ncbi:MAG: alpha-galactosidase, partial [Candidatus Latescibacteria bacterium]|nr:alpha-galactosidase [Candidatus Latescibacterota bacterium]
LHVADAEHTCYDEDAQLELRRTLPFATCCWEEGLYLSQAPRPILDEVRAFARTYEAFHQLPALAAPPAAWDPVWCSWYGIKMAVDADYIRRQAPLLADWGFGSLIVDAGWFRPDAFDEGTGHYHPDPAKFPDLAGLVSQVQAQGLKILLWCSPLFHLDGIHTQPFVASHLHRPESSAENLRFLCPRSRAVREYACRTVRHLLGTYGADGLKIDFIDPLMDRACQPCAGDHEHDIADYGEAVHALLQGIHQAARSVRPDALLEFRMNYSTLATRPFATSHRAQDSPFDFDHIRRMCTRLKSYIVDPAKGRQGNVAVHTDPAYWLPAESPENVACFMASLVTSAVPMLSMDLGALPEEHQRLVRAWLRFYRQHQDLILFGEDQLLDADPHHSLFCRWRGDQALWGLFTPAIPGRLQVPAPGIRELWLLNGSEAGEVGVRLEGLDTGQGEIEVYDRGLEPRHHFGLQVSGGIARLDTAVEKGGALRILLGG